MVQKDIPYFKFDEKSDLPLWVQLRDRMSYLIDSGYYKPGEKLPTVRKYAADLHIAYNTVSKAYMALERDGYVRTVRGSGVFVKEAHSVTSVTNHVDMLTEEFIKNCLDEGMSYDDITSHITEYIRALKREHEEV